MNIALVAHDKRKEELIDWVNYNLLELSKHTLIATGTTGRLIQEVIDKVYQKLVEKKEAVNGLCKGLWSSNDNFLLEHLNNKKVERLKSGPLGGDQEIGAMISEGRVDCLIFFCDNLITQGHQQDVGALSRLASLYNIAFASNRTTADMILTSKLWNNSNYTRIVPNCIQDYIDRKL